MLITYSFIGVSRGDYQFLFFLLFKDYIDAQSRFVRELEPYLERFARNLGNSGALVKPFTGDIETVRHEVLAKNWTDSEREQIEITPGILMIDQDFEAFDPREHPWVHIRLATKLDEELGIPSVATWLDILADAVINAERNPFKVAQEVQHEITTEDAVKIFEAKPGAFGFSIDLVAGAEFLMKLFRRWKAHA
jgi:hypothetical protein